MYTVCKMRKLDRVQNMHECLRRMIKSVALLTSHSLTVTNIVSADQKRVECHF